MSEWRNRYRAVLVSDVSGRDGLGWEFLNHQGLGAWTVFREDGGPFPVLSSARGQVDLPERDELAVMTQMAVADLLGAAGLEDGDGWMTANISAGLLLASMEVESWEGEEWALESGVDDEAPVWAASGDPRTPFAWLRARHADGESVIAIYQDDAVFGLRFNSTFDPQLPGTDLGSLRSRRQVQLVRGPINQVEVVYDTLVEGGVVPGLVTEALLHGDTESTLLIAAEAYSANEWHLYDESVVGVTNAAAANSVPWIPARQRWRSTQASRPT